MIAYTADFETTTDEEDCRIWAYALCNIDDPTEFYYGTTFEEFIDFCANPINNYTLYFHNLKFDGSFIISWLLHNGYEYISDKREKRDNTFTTLITDMGQFYAIEIYFTAKGHHVNKVKILDSLKIFPNFSVERVAEGFGLSIHKLEIDYKQKRPLGWQLTQQEIDYIRNDVEIMARALKIMFSEGLNKMTIAGDAFASYKEFVPNFRKRFPILPKAVDEDIRLSYRGGFTYVNEIYKEKKIGKGIIKFYGDKLVFELKKKTLEFKFDEIEEMTILGKKKMNFYVDNKTYQFYGDKRINMIKYLNMFYLIRNRKRGDGNDFMGL